jgi:alpha-amylase/alpha-mannosidase (GH57 family)
MPTARYLCIHCHCYQPPRENPWLETIELQDSAYPYHDWNERVTAECYATNAAARILDEQQRIASIVNNYQNISFNFGPTLLPWMQEKASETYAPILEADRSSAERFSGHGSAMAQCYNHMIMPLANSRDKQTQVRWGIEDFRHRFGREPEGMWLPETAVDLETLSILAEHGMRFTVLAPAQAQAIRPIGEDAWQDVTQARVDPTRAYRCNLPSGRSIALFFYDGPVSQAVAFEGLLSNGEKFAQRLVGGFSGARTWPQLMHIATDGETYGHHHRHGEMALAWALGHLESEGSVRITNYAEFLEENPPTHEVQIIENTAWSCAHGVGRWATNCGCNTGGKPGWNQEWRAPLRAALDWLRDTVTPLYEQKAGAMLRFPWQARNDYVRVILDRSPETRRRFLARHASHELTERETVEVWKLLELQRHAMLMYTSCGWFFSELSGIETVQVIQYAGRVVQLAEDVLDTHLETDFLYQLGRARSNIPEKRDGAAIYQTLVRPSMVDLPRVAAHFAVSSLFEDYPRETRVYCYQVETEDSRTMRAGRTRIGVGKVRLRSDITRSSQSLVYAALHFGDHNVHAGVREFGGRKSYERITSELQHAFSHADLAAVIREMDSGFGKDTYSLKSLFRDEQRRILGLILDSTLEDAESEYRQLYEHHAPLMRFLTDLHMPLPEALRSTASYALNSRLRKAFAEGNLDAELIQSHIEEAQALAVPLDTTTLEFTLRRTLERLSEAFRAQPGDLETFARLARGVSLARRLPFPVVFWVIQNRCWDAMETTLPVMRTRAATGDAAAHAWVDRFVTLCEDLSLRLSG